MTPKLDVLRRIAEAGLVAVVRAENPEQALRIAEATHAGGCPAIEVTFTVPGAHRVIERLAAAYEPSDLILAGGHRLEYAWHGPAPEEAPTLVFLHEGLGSVSAWRDFPLRLARATGCGALVYSRAGYGNSDAVALPRPTSFMHDEALVTLPDVLAHFAVRDFVLVGHSDGGSIALIYAGGKQDARLRGLVLEAPHVFVEDVSVESIRRAARDYLNGRLKQALERRHGRNVECAFWGWNRVWLDPEFRSWNIEEYLGRITVPTLVIQGELDEYGTLQQVEAIKSGCAGPVETVILPECGHSPHREQPERTLEAIASFARSAFSNLSA